jgi:hypothetical protein
MLDGDSMYTRERSSVAGLILLVGAAAAFAQASGPPAKPDNLYSMALIASISEMEKEWGYIDDGDRGNRIRTDYHRVRVRKNPEITDDLSSDFGEHHVEYMDDQAMIGRYQAKRKEFSVLEIHPMRSTGSQLKIQVSESWVKYEKGRLILEFSDWSDVKFQYDCEKQAYTISAVKLGGI